MKSRFLTYIIISLLLVACGTGNKDNEPYTLTTPNGVDEMAVSIDTMDVDNPFITYDVATNRYYMVADGGYMWTSADMHVWNGPYDVLQQDTTSWIGASPIITSPEIHKYNNRYYYMATFENPDSIVNDANGNPFVRRSCVALVADSIVGPYVTIDNTRSLLAVEEMAAHPTFCTDDLDVGYMIYNHQGEQNGDATVQIVRFTPDLGRRMGEAYVMFTASQNSWSRSEVEGVEQFSPIMEAPDLFYTGDYVMGIMFNTYIDETPAVGVAYSQTGTLNGPWVIEEEPMLTGYRAAAMFNDYDGTLVMVTNMDTIIGESMKRVPKLFKMESQFNKLQIEGHYKF